MVDIEGFLTLGGWGILVGLADGEGIEGACCSIRVGMQILGNGLSRGRHGN